MIKYCAIVGHDGDHDEEDGTGSVLQLLPTSMVASMSGERWTMIFIYTHLDGSENTPS